MLYSWGGDDDPFIQIHATSVLSILVLCAHPYSRDLIVI